MDPSRAAKLTAIPMKLLSNHIVTHRDLEVEQPRNLGESVTVKREIQARIKPMNFVVREYVTIAII